MTSWKTESALFQAERDLVLNNRADRDMIMAIERRVEGRSRLLKMLRRYFRRRGMVDIGGDASNPEWRLKSDLEEAK